MEIAASDRPLPERRPIGQRGGVVAVPRPVPHLDEVGRLGQGHPPGAVPRPRVVHRHQPAAFRGLRLPAVRRVPKVDPSDVAETVGMTDVGRHFLPGHEEDPGVVAGSGQVRMVTDRVVIGDREKVEAPCGSPGSQLDDLQRSVGVHRVTVEVTGEPLVTGCGRQLPPGRALRTGRQRRWFRGSRLTVGSGDIDRDVDPTGCDTVEAEDHLPRSADDPRRYPGVAHSSVTTTFVRSDPDQPQNRSGPISPRSRIVSVRS